MSVYTVKENLSFTHLYEYLYLGILTITRVVTLIIILI